MPRKCSIMFFRISNNHLILCL